MTSAARLTREVLWLAGHHALRNPCLERLVALSRALRTCADVDPTVRAAFQAYQTDRSPAAHARLQEALDTLMDSLHSEVVGTS